MTFLPDCQYEDDVQDLSSHVSRIPNIGHLFPQGTCNKEDGFIEYSENFVEVSYNALKCIIKFISKGVISKQARTGNDAFACFA